MADAMHLAMLTKGVSAWNEWRAANVSAVPDLSEANLRGINLAGINLGGADLHDADLRGTDLSTAVLVGGNLAGANFFKAILDGADLSGANLFGAKFLNCAQLVTTRNWQSTFRELDLACGAPIPPIAERS
jgi:uncharacterized protein YjbI with pentapeptide repeats